MANYTFIGPADPSDGTSQVSVGGFTMRINTYADLTLSQVQAAQQGGRLLFAVGIVAGSSPAAGSPSSTTPNPSSSLSVLANQLQSLQTQVNALGTGGGVSSGTALAFVVALGN